MNPGYVLIVAIVMALATGAAAMARDEGSQFLAGISAFVCALTLLHWVFAR